MSEQPDITAMNDAQFIAWVATINDPAVMLWAMGKWASELGDPYYRDIERALWARADVLMKSPAD